MKTTRRSFVITGAAILALALASAAAASTAQLTPLGVDYSDSGLETNTVVVRESSMILGGFFPPAPIEITDNVPIEARSGFLHAWGCEQVTLMRVWCALETNVISITLGDRDDTFFQQLPWPVKTFVDGGSGFDDLNGGPGTDNLFGRDGDDRLAGASGGDNLEGSQGSDFLIGGAGSDLLNGGDCQDTADYARRTAPVSVTLDVTLADLRAGAPLVPGNDGESGEGDNVLASVEEVRGGAGDDTLVGHAELASANTLRGNDGNDTLAVRGGDDVLDGGAGADFLDGGPENDRLIGGAASDLIVGGGGDDSIDAVEGDRDQITCGEGNDHVWIDPFDRYPSDCRQVEVVPCCGLEAAALDMTAITYSFRPPSHARIRPRDAYLITRPDPETLAAGAGRQRHRARARLGDPPVERSAAMQARHSYRLPDQETSASAGRTALTRSSTSREQ